MERNEFKQSVYDLKCEVLDEIRKVLPEGVHYFAQPFFIHYVEGEVANTEICRAIEVSKADEQMVRVHHQSEGYGAEDIDITDGEGIFNYETNSFADMLGNLKSEIRGRKISELRQLIEQYGGKITFNGDFTFTGIQEAVTNNAYYDDTRLFGMRLVDGKIAIDDMWEGDTFENDEDYICFEELDRVIAYVKDEWKKRKFTIKASRGMSRTFEIMADDYESAVAIVKAELEKCPLNKEDIDWDEVV